MKEYLTEIPPVPAIGQADDSAADLIAGVAGGLRVEIIRHLVNHHGFAQNLRNDKAFIVERDPCIPLISKKGKEISRMFWMFGSRRVKMSACILKIIAAEIGRASCRERV